MALSHCGFKSSFPKGCVCAQIFFCLYFIELFVFFFLNSNSSLYTLTKFFVRYMFLKIFSLQPIGLPFCFYNGAFEEQTLLF